jgi:hypothetical protein
MSIVWTLHLFLVLAERDSAHQQAFCSSLVKKCTHTHDQRNIALTLHINLIMFRASKHIDLSHRAARPRWDELHPMIWQRVLLSELVDAYAAAFTSMVLFGITYLVAQPFRRWSIVTLCSSSVLLNTVLLQPDRLLVAPI